MRRDGAGPGRRGARRHRSTALGRHGLFRLLSLNCPARPGVPPDEPACHPTSWCTSTRRCPTAGGWPVADLDGPPRQAVDRSWTPGRPSLRTLPDRRPRPGCPTPGTPAARPVPPCGGLPRRPTARAPALAHPGRTDPHRQRLRRAPRPSRPPAPRRSLRPLPAPELRHARGSPHADGGIGYRSVFGSSADGTAALPPRPSAR
jgi:hypothetical protein